MPVVCAALAPLPPAGAAEPGPEALWKKIAPYFRPPPKYAGDFGDFRSPLFFYDGRPVQNAQDWQKRRQEILKIWHDLMGPWPTIIEKSQVEILSQTRRENFTQYKVRFAITPHHRTEGYLLVPDGKGPLPAVLAVWYNAEGGIGGGNYAFVDYAYQLARRSFVTLSVGLNDKGQDEVTIPPQIGIPLQPLSGLAYIAANCYHVLASRPEVDPDRVGIVGHSYGAKWSMFAACLYDKFACAAFSDGGIVFDESRSNVNYWHPLYLGYDSSYQPGTKHPEMPGPGQPRRGAYRRMIEEGRQLHELHALMAPRPFLVSGGAEDPLSRWRALNHTVAVNKLLGYEHRVAMTSRPEHQGNQDSNEIIYLFFEYFLKYRGIERKS
jgi:dienelactone hydrolase